ncbi:MAG: bifunctional demethylmenaquinone methyltransferase/2-methoxy-6-polyprenyl-1,4-benzoquinol methylase UbiE [Planctomycetota bacterium]
MPEITEASKTGPAWSDDELRDSPHARADKAGRVRDMFGSIAHAYDLNNHLHSLGIDHLWRRAAVRAAGVRSGETVFDVACGTGDLTQAFARHTSADEIIGGDFTPRMLDLAREKQRKLASDDRSRIRYVDADAMALDRADASVDVLSIAFGIRNVQDVPRALAEFRRVLRPGGRLVILEFDRPRNPLVRVGNDFYSGWLMPRTASLIARDRSGAYRYLPKSVETFLTMREMATLVEDAGFTGVTTRSLTLGIAGVLRGEVPSEVPGEVPGG